MWHSTNTRTSGRSIILLVSQLLAGFVDRAAQGNPIEYEFEPSLRCSLTQKLHQFAVSPIARVQDIRAPLAPMSHA